MRATSKYIGGANLFLSGGNGEIRIPLSNLGNPATQTKLISGSGGQQVFHSPQIGIINCVSMCASTYVIVNNNLLLTNGTLAIGADDALLVVGGVSAIFFVGLTSTPDDKYNLESFKKLYRNLWYSSK